MMKQPPKYELYDLQTDPYEFKNLADDPGHEKTLTRLTTKLLHWQNETGDALKSPELALKLFSMIREAGTAKRKALNYKPFMKIP